MMNVSLGSEFDRHFELALLLGSRLSKLDDKLLRHEGKCTLYSFTSCLIMPLLIFFDVTSNEMETLW
jgi:hypothetical protein